MQTLLIDNYDSFTFNLYQLIAEVNGVAPIVVRNDAASWEEIRDLDFDNIVISPGPGRPEVPGDFGICRDAILEATVPLLGVCLGHQGLCHLFGGKVDYAGTVMHGRPSDVFHSNEGMFEGLPSPFSAIRYHSLLVSDLPDTLRKIAWTEDDILMGVEHTTKPIWGVQFHPESINTEYGHQLLRNFRDRTAEHLKLHPPRRRITDGARPRRNREDYDVVLREFTEIKRPAEGSTLHGKPFRIHFRRLPMHIDQDQVFLKHFANSQPNFWLDSALFRNFSRFSYMGDASGPHAEFVSYDLPSRTVSVERNGSVEEFNESIFSYLDRTLNERYANIDGLPFDFNLGYAGYLGYELKADCGADAAYEASTPDAAFVFADRMVVFDQEDDIVYLICIDDIDNDARAREWLDTMWDSIQDLDPIKPWIPSPNPAPMDQTFRHDDTEYLRLISDAQREIKKGETYEVCLTNMITHHVTIDPLNTYRALRESNPAPYATYLDFPGVAVLSSSPERFLTIEPNGMVESKPIKGTRKRGRTTAEDEQHFEDLRTHEKDRSENLMIVDLLRNDLGMVSDVGSVHVSKIFAVETYATVHQLVSTIRGRLRRGVSAIQCIKAAYPGGSMTGAPKKRTMEIIDRLEEGPRGVYSGAIGFLGLNGSADLNIAIRTIVVTPDDVTVGVGGAIVDLSDPQDELEEMILKSRALTDAISKTAKPRSDEDERRARDRSVELLAFRNRLNNIDASLVAMLGERYDICRAVAHHKRTANIPMMQNARVDEVKERCAEMGESHDVDPQFIRELYTLIINESCRIEDEIIDALPDEEPKANA